MKKEICAAVDFLSRLVGKNEDISAQQVAVFRTSLGTIMTEKFKDHWFPDIPCKGQAYRCIRVNGRERRDPILEQAAKMCGLQYEHLKLPFELTVWVDPEEVCCRFGEDEGSYCTVASFKDNKENFSDNVVEDFPKKSPVINQILPEIPKKSKKFRKVSEKQKKCSSSKSQAYHLGLESPLIKSFYCHDWNRSIRANGFLQQDHHFMRRPKKSVRSIYPNDRYHWARQ